MQTNHHVRAALYASCGIGLAWCGPAHATDGYFAHGLGAAAKGAAGVAIALPQDAMAIATNPAGATALDRRLDVGVDVFIPRRDAAVTGNQAGLDGAYDGNGANPFVLGDVAYVHPLSDRLSGGLAVYAHGGMNSVYERNPFAAFGATGDAGVDLKQGFIVPSVAYEIVEGHSLGVSAVGVVQSFRAYGIEPFAASSADPQSFSGRGNDWSLGIGYKVGYLGHFGDRIALGAFYQSEVSAQRFEKYAGLFPDRGAFNVPPSWGVGVSVRLLDRLTLAADFKRIEYDEVDAVGASLGNLFEGRPFGAPGGPGFGWRDISVTKLGAVWQATDAVVLRAGYGHSQNPVPDEETLVNIISPGVVEDHFTLGVTVPLDDRLELTAHGLIAPRNEVTGPIPAPFGGGKARIAVSEIAFGFAAGWRF